MISTWRSFSAVLLVFAGTTGCSQTEERYSVPERVCGVPMSEDVVRSVLPDGAKLEEFGEALPEKYNICGLLVDGESAVKLSFGKDTEFYEPLKAYSYRFHKAEEIALRLPGAGALDDDYAIVMLKCGLPRFPYVIARFQVPPPGGVAVKLSRADLERFAVDYTTGAVQELGCPEAKASVGSE